MSRIKNAISKLAYWEGEHRYLDREVRSLERQLSQKRKARRAAKAGVERARASITRLGGQS